MALHSAASFDDLSISTNLLRGIYAYGFEYGTEVQLRFLQEAIKSSSSSSSLSQDLIFQSPSGSGKTCAAVMAALHALDGGLKAQYLEEQEGSKNAASTWKPSSRALFIVPTRELATQVEAVTAEIGTYLWQHWVQEFEEARKKKIRNAADLTTSTGDKMGNKQSVASSCVTEWDGALGYPCLPHSRRNSRSFVPRPHLSHSFVGGNSVQADLRALNSGVGLCVGTTGRLLDVIRRGALRTSAFTHLFIDEADVFYTDAGSADGLYEVFRFLPKTIHVTLMSTTIATSGFLSWSQKFMRRPILVQTDALTSNGGGMLSSPKKQKNEDEENKTRQDKAIAVHHFYVDVEEQFKLDTLDDLLSDFIASAGVQTIIFANTRRKVDWIAETINKRMSYVMSYFHEDMVQGERERCIQEFKSGQRRILVTTNMLARGIDIPHCQIIIHYDHPPSTEVYLHRSGRCGRFGRKGVVISFLTSSNIQSDNNLYDALGHAVNTEIEELPLDFIKYLLPDEEGKNIKSDDAKAFLSKRDRKYPTQFKSGQFVHVDVSSEKEEISEKGEGQGSVVALTEIKSMFKYDSSNNSGKKNKNTTANDHQDEDEDCNREPMYTFPADSKSSWQQEGAWGEEEEADENEVRNHDDDDHVSKQISPNPKKEKFRNCFCVPSASPLLASFQQLSGVLTTVKWIGPSTNTDASLEPSLSYSPPNFIESSEKKNGVENPSRLDLLSKAQTLLQELTLSLQQWHQEFLDEMMRIMDNKKSTSSDSAEGTAFCSLENLTRIFNQKRLKILCYFDQQWGKQKICSTASTTILTWEEAEMDDAYEGFKEEWANKAPQEEEGKGETTNEDISTAIVEVSFHFAASLYAVAQKLRELEHAPSIDDDQTAASFSRWSLTAPLIANKHNIVQLIVHNQQRDTFPSEHEGTPQWWLHPEEQEQDPNSSDASLLLLKNMLNRISLHGETLTSCGGSVYFSDQTAQCLGPFHHMNPFVFESMDVEGLLDFSGWWMVRCNLI